MLWETEQGEQNGASGGTVWVVGGPRVVTALNKVMGYPNKKGRPRGEGIIQIKLDSSKGVDHLDIWGKHILEQAWLRCLPGPGWALECLLKEQTFSPLMAKPGVSQRGRGMFKIPGSGPQLRPLR